MTLKKKLALGGSIAMIVGVFMPVIWVAFFGSMDYLGSSMGYLGDGTIVLVLGIISLLIALSTNYRWLWVTGIASLVTMGFSLIHFSRTLAQEQASLSAEVADAEATFQAARLQWGWFPLIGGAVLILFAAGMKSVPVPVIQEPQEFTADKGCLGPDANPGHWSDGSAADPKCLGCDNVGICKLLDSSSPTCPKRERGNIMRRSIIIVFVLLALVAGVGCGPKPISKETLDYFYGLVNQQYWQLAGTGLTLNDEYGTKQLVIASTGTSGNRSTLPRLIMMNTVPRP